MRVDVDLRDDMKDVYKHGEESTCHLGAPEVYYILGRYLVSFERRAGDCDDR